MKVIPTTRLTEPPKRTANASQENQNRSKERSIPHPDKIEKAPQQLTRFDETLPPATRRRSDPRKPWSTQAFTSKGRASPPYLSWQPTIGRNSAFIGLTAEQKDELGGIEYRSLKTLSWVLISKCYSTPPMHMAQTSRLSCKQKADCAYYTV